MSVADELLAYLEAAYTHDTPLKLDTLNQLLAKAPRLAGGSKSSEDQGETYI